MSLIRRLTCFPADFLDKSMESHLNKLRQESARSHVCIHTLACWLCSMRQCNACIWLSRREFCCIWGKWQQEAGLTGFQNWNIHSETTVNNRYKRNDENEKLEEVLKVLKEHQPCVISHQKHEVFWWSNVLGGAINSNWIHAVVELLPSMGKVLDPTPVLPKHTAVRTFATSQLREPPSRCGRQSTGLS